jgi:Flp pilus assembly protein TadG
MRRVLLHRAPGQSLFVVILAMAAMFMVIGLGIDGGLLYAHRRLMQNTADAACLAAANQLAIGGTVVTARTSAISTITQNIGPTGPGTGANAPGTLTYTDIDLVYSNSANPAAGTVASPNPNNDGTGAGLTRGIEISGPQVRVALESPAFTYFIRLLGQPEYNVVARARCDATAGGGGTPFAVARWRSYKNGNNNNNSESGISTDETIPSQLVGNNGPDFVRDILARTADSVIATRQNGNNWPDWGTQNFPGSAASGTGLYRQPSVPAGTPPQNVMQSGNTNQLRSATEPGPEVVIAGSGSISNDGNNFTGPVLLDFRNITSANAEFYNGIDETRATSPNKDFITRNILEGYNGPFIPPGTQLGYVRGVSAGQVQKPFDTRYNVGQVVSVLIYNGTIYNTDADFDVSAPNNPVTTDVEQFRNNATPALYPVGTTPQDCNITPYTSYYLHQGTFPNTSVNPPSTISLTPWMTSYRVLVDPFIAVSNNQRDPYSSNFALRAFSSTSGDTLNNLEVSWNSGGWQRINDQGYVVNPPELGAGPSPRTFSINFRQTATTSCTFTRTDPLSPTLTITETVDIPARPVEGAFTFYLEAKDDTFKRRGRYVFMQLNANANDFHFFAPAPVEYSQVRLGNQVETLSQEFRLRTVGGQDLRFNSSGVSVGQIQWFDINDITEQMTARTGANGGQPNNINATLVVDNQNRNLLNITIQPTAELGRSYYLRIPVTYNGRTHWAWYYMAIRPATSPSNTVNNFVYALGYANFVITEIRSNAIYGRAVSGLLMPGDIMAGMVPRLVPWE